MTDNVEHIDISANVIERSGAVECCVVYNGYLESKVYYGYSEREAKSMFRDYLRDTSQ